LVKVPVGDEVKLLTGIAAPDPVKGVKATVSLAGKERLQPVSGELKEVLKVAGPADGWPLMATTPPVVDREPLGGWVTLPPPALAAIAPNDRSELRVTVAAETSVTNPSAGNSRMEIRVLPGRICLAGSVVNQK
jgi:hypothetical protein